MTAARDLAAWAQGVRVEHVPDSAVRAACRHLLDGIGCAIAGARTGAASAAVSVASGMQAPPEATVIASGERVASPAAALANGALVHALDFDDTHAGALVHATAAVLPAAFAVGEEVRASGEEVLLAALAGYETVIRLGSAVPHGFHARGLHATSVCGVFAAAIVAARLMRLGVGETTAALGIAGSLASGSLEFLATGSNTKTIHPGLSSMNGIVAARLAAAGAEGPESILEGEHGLYRTLAGAEVAPETITAGLGQRWEVERITIKPYPVCQLSHASLDALRGVRAGVGPLQAIDRVVFDVAADAEPIVCEPVAAKRRPRTEYEGKFSLAFCAAVLLADGDVTVDSFARMDRPDVLALADKVEHRVIAFEGPAADAPGRVEIHRRDGEVLTREVAGSRGSVAVPLADEDLHAKLAANCAGDAADVQRLAELCMGLPALPGLAPLLASTLAFREARA